MAVTATTECTFPGCDHEVRARGLCVGHYGQRRRGQELCPLRDYEKGNEQIREMPEADIAWLAGLLEGEGHFCFHQGFPCIQLSMTDFDVVEKVRDIVGGCGSISRAFDARGGRKPAKRWEIRGERARILMERILPHMGDRRSLRIKEVVNGCNS